MRTSSKAGSTTLNASTEGPGSPISLKRDVSLLDMRDEDAINKATADLNFKKVSMRQALWYLITTQWLGVGDKIRTTGSATSIKDNFVNVGVVAALLFTMVAIDTSVVGDELVDFTYNVSWAYGGITVDTCGQIYATLGSIALWSLFGAVLHSLYLYCQCSELNTSLETYYWAKTMGPFWINFHFIYLVIGFLSFIFSQVWLAATLLKTGWLIGTICYLVLGVAVPMILASTISVRALYNAKAHVTEEYNGMKPTTV